MATPTALLAPVMTTFMSYSDASGTELRLTETFQITHGAG
jgi:hypothetical protein